MGEGRITVSGNPIRKESLLFAGGAAPVPPPSLAVALSSFAPRAASGGFLRLCRSLTPGDKGALASLGASRSPARPGRTVSPAQGRLF